MKFNELEITVATFPDAGPGGTKYRARVTHNGRIILEVQRASSGVYDWTTTSFKLDNGREGASDTVLDALTEGLVGQVSDVFGAAAYLLRSERRQWRALQR